MMKWKVTKNSRSSSVDRSVDGEISEVCYATKFLPGVPGLSKVGQVRRDDDALLPPPRRKQQQNGNFGLSRKDSFAASDCIPINLREILGISRQRSESNLSSLPVLNGERRRSRSEVRISSTDRLAVAYHACQVTGPQNKLTERNQPKTDKLTALTGRCPSPPMKNSRWLRGRQRQREPRKPMLGVCGGVGKTVTPNGKITSEMTDHKNSRGSETSGLINTLPTDKPKQIREEINDKLKNSKDINSTASYLNGETEKELDKENIKICRKPTNGSGKQCKEGYKFRRNKGFAPRPGMRRNQNENIKNSSGFEAETNDKTDGSKSCSENTSAEAEKVKPQCKANGTVSDSPGNDIPRELEDSDCKANGDLNSQTDFNGDSSGHCAKKFRDFIGATVTSEPYNETKLFGVCRQKLIGNNTTGLPQTANGQHCDFIERTNERNNEYSVAAVKEPEAFKSQGNGLLNGGNESTASENERNGRNSEDSGLETNGLDSHGDIERSDDGLQVKQDTLIPSASTKTNDTRNSEGTAKLNNTKYCPDEYPELFSNEREENIYENVPNRDLTKCETVSKELDVCIVESKDSLAETMLDSLAVVEEQSDYFHTPMDNCSEVKTYYPPTPPPKKKLASHQGMTVSVVVRKPTTSEESPKPSTCKEPEISRSESFVVKKSFVLTIAKQEMGFRSMCASKESTSQALETAPAGVKKEEHQISVTFLCSGNVNKPWLGRQASASAINDVRLRSFSMPPISRYQQQDLLCLESIRSRSRERRNREKQTTKRKNHRQRKKDPGFHMPKAVIDELSKVLEKRKRSIEDDDDEDDYDEYQEGDSE